MQVCYSDRSSTRNGIKQVENKYRLDVVSIDIYVMMVLVSETQLQKLS